MKQTQAACLCCTDKIPSTGISHNHSRDVSTSIQAFLANPTKSWIKWDFWQCLLNINIIQPALQLTVIKLF